MKKLILPILLLIAVVFSCQREPELLIKPTSKHSFTSSPGVPSVSIQKPGDPTNGNYCFGCQSYSDDFWYGCMHTWWANDNVLECMDIRTWDPEEYGRTCPVKAVIDGIGGGGPLYPLPDTVAIHEFRDSWMTTPKINIYKAFTYTIGNAMLNKGGLDLLASSSSIASKESHYSFLIATTRVADSLKVGQWGCIPISTTYKADALLMIAHYRTLDAAPGYQWMLDKITSDLNSHTGLTRAQIYALY